MPARIYREKDADMKVLKGKTFAVIGFGSQGHAHALNLKESRVNVIIGLYKGSKSRAVAKKLGRNYIGLEREQDYVTIATERLKDIKRTGDISLLTTPQKRTEPRVPFGALVERGLLKPGDVLTDPREHVTARVRADGTIISSDHRGSIHKVGAAVQGAPACNGWTFWHFRSGSKSVPIDILRQKVRAELH